MKTLSWVGTKVAETVDYVGEGVVSVLGLDDSRFQDVIDNMTEEEREHAEAVHAERQQEYRDAGILIDEAVPAEEVVADASTVSSGSSSKVVDVEVGSVVANTGDVELSTAAVASRPPVTNSASSSGVVDSKDIVINTADNNV